MRQTSRRTSAPFARVRSWWPALQAVGRSALQEQMRTRCRQRAINKQKKKRTNEIDERVNFSGQRVTARAGSLVTSAFCNMRMRNQHRQPKRTMREHEELGLQHLLQRAQLDVQLNRVLVRRRANLLKRQTITLQQTIPTINADLPSICCVDPMRC